MRLVIFVGLVLLSSCILSEKPFFGPGESVAMPQLEGNWRDTGKSPSYARISRAGDGYQLVGKEHPDSLQSDTVLFYVFRMKENLYADVSYDDTDSLGVSQTLHYLLKVTLEPNKIQLYRLSEKAIQQMADRQQIPIAYHLEKGSKIGDGATFTFKAATPELQSFIAAHADERGFFEKHASFSKVK